MTEGGGGGDRGTDRGKPRGGYECAIERLA